MIHKYTVLLSGTLDQNDKLVSKVGHGTKSPERV